MTKNSKSSTIWIWEEHKIAKNVTNVYDSCICSHINANIYSEKNKIGLWGSPTVQLSSDFLLLTPNGSVEVLEQTGSTVF